MSNHNEPVRNGKHSSRKAVTLIIAVIILILTAGVSYLFGMSFATNTSIFSSGIKSFTDTVNDSRKIFLIRNKLYESYLEEIDREKLLYSTISGMVNSLGDPYTRYFKSTIEQVEYSFDIGFDAKNENGKMLVNSIVEESPAYLADIRIGDYIVNVSGNEISEVGIEKIGQALQKEIGETVSIIVERNGERINLGDIKIVEFMARIDHIKYEKISEDIGYIRIDFFGQDVAQQVKDALKEMNPKGIIIDVRDNGGGDIQECVQILSEFLPEGTVLYRDESKGGVMQDIKAKKGQWENLEIVLLGNSNSASASENLIASLVDNNKAVFVGEKTFGKGIGQYITPIGEGENISITYARTHRVNGELIHGIGISPDVELKYESYSKDREDYRTNLKGFMEIDPQYKKAVEIITEKLK